MNSTPAAFSAPRMAPSRGDRAGQAMSAACNAEREHGTAHARGPGAGAQGTLAARVLLGRSEGAAARGSSYPTSPPASYGHDTVVSALPRQSPSRHGDPAGYMPEIDSGWPLAASGAPAKGGSRNGAMRLYG